MKVYNNTQILVLIDKYGEVVRYCTFGGEQAKNRLMEEWKRLYANNKAFQQSTFKVIDNDYAAFKKSSK